MQAPDGPGFVIRADTGICRRVTATQRDRQTHIDFSAFIQMTDNMIGVANLDIVIDLDVTRCHQTGALFAQGHFSFFLAAHHQGNTLQVQQDFNDIFLHTLNGAVLMKHAIDLGFCNGTTRH